MEQLSGFVHPVTGNHAALLPRLDLRLCVDALLPFPPACEMLFWRIETRSMTLESEPLACFFAGGNFFPRLLLFCSIIFIKASRYSSLYFSGSQRPAMLLMRERAMSNSFCPIDCEGIFSSAGSRNSSAK